MDYWLSSQQVFYLFVIKLESITFIALKLIDKYTLTNLKYLKIFEQNKMFFVLKTKR